MQFLSLSPQQLLCEVLFFYILGGFRRVTILLLILIFRTLGSEKVAICYWRFIQCFCYLNMITLIYLHRVLKQRHYNLYKEKYITYLLILFFRNLAYLSVTYLS